jgi:hypothetical protein
MRKIFLAIVATVLLVSVGLAISRTRTRAAFPKPPSAQTEAYNAVLAKAQQLPSLSLTETNREADAAYVQKNKEVLDQLLTLVTAQTQVAQEFKDSYLEKHMNDLRYFKGAALGLELYSRHLAVEGKTNEAAGVARGMFDLALVTVRGGVIIDALVALAVEKIAMRQTENLLPGMDRDSIEGTTQKLKSFQESFPSAQQVLANERLFFRKTGGIAAGLVRIVARKTLQKNDERFIFNMESARTNRAIFLKTLQTVPAAEAAPAGS